MDTQGNFATGANVSLLALDFTAPIPAVSSAIQANDAYRIALNARRALLKKQIAGGDIMLDNMEKFVDPALEEVRVKNMDEWAVFAIGATTVRPLLTNKQLNADDSPFCEEAENRKRYLAYTSSHPWTSKERQALRKQVISENKRLAALELRDRNQDNSLDAIAEQSDSNFDKSVEDIDWRRVASNMSEISRSALGKRTAQECKVRWIGNDHPDLRDPAMWDDDEDNLLRNLVGDRDVRGGDVDWVVLARQFKGSRTPAQCLSRCVLLEEDADANSDAKVQWTAEEDADFCIALEEHGVGNWAAISLAMESTRSPAACAHRYVQTLKPDIKRGAWSADEDNKLRDAVALHGQKWSRVKDLVPGRTAAQCRERFVRSVSLTTAAKVRPWTKKEDAQLLYVMSTFGIKDWESVAKCIGSRDGEQCRKRWQRIQTDGGQAETSKEDNDQPKKHQTSKGAAPYNKARAAASTSSTLPAVRSSAPSRAREQSSIPLAASELTAERVHSSTSPLSASTQTSTFASAPEVISNNSKLSQPRDRVKTQDSAVSASKKPGPKPKPRYTGRSRAVSNSDSSFDLEAPGAHTSAGVNTMASSVGGSRGSSSSGAQTAIAGEAAPNTEPRGTEGLRRSSRLKRV